VFLVKGVEINEGDQDQERERDQSRDQGQGTGHDPQGEGGVSLQEDQGAGEGDFPDHAAEADQAQLMDTDFILEILTRIAESQIWKRFS